jgi:hypothetical protein
VPGADARRRRAPHNASVLRQVQRDVPAAGQLPQRGQTCAAAWTAVVVLIALGAAPDAARGDWTVGADAQVRHDNNVGNAAYPADIIEDTVVGGHASLYQVVAFGDGYSLSAGGDLSGETFHRLDGLSNATLGGGLALKKKWGLGAFAPWIRVGASIARSDYHDDYRNASIYRATLAAGRRIDERWNLWAGYTYERRAAATQDQQEPGISGDAYSQDSHRLAVNVEYALNQVLTLEADLSVRHGDIVTTTLNEYRIYDAARAIAEDPAFGPEAYAYKLVGTTYGFRVGLNYSPTPHTLIECGFQRFDTRADGGNGYTKSIPEISWSYRY